MPDEVLPSWLRSLLVIVGLVVIAGQAIGHAAGREPSLPLLVVGAVLVGVLSPDKLDRFLPGRDVRDEDPR